MLTGTCHPICQEHNSTVCAVYCWVLKYVGHYRFHCIPLSVVLCYYGCPLLPTYPPAVPVFSVCVYTFHLLSFILFPSLPYIIPFLVLTLPNILTCSLISYLTFTLHLRDGNTHTHTQMFPPSPSSNCWVFTSYYISLLRSILFR